MRISSFFVLAGYLAANAYVAARTSIFLHRNLPERVAKLISLLTAGVYSVFAMGMPLAHILPEGTAYSSICFRLTSSSRCWRGFPSGFTGRKGSPRGRETPS